MNDFVTTALWDGATRDIDAERAREAMVRGKLAAAPSWPFLASARSQAEFDTKLALISDRLQEQVPADVFEPVVASLTEDWNLLQDQRVAEATQQREASLRAEAAAKAAEPVRIQAGQSFFDAQTQTWKMLIQTRTGALAAIDPSDAWRYSTYPDMNPPVDNGALQGPDGFVADLAQGEDRSAEAYARQTTPGQWNVTPGTEWPTRPNAGSVDQTPVYASRQTTAAGENGLYFVREHTRSGQPLEEENSRGNRSFDNEDDARNYHAQMVEQDKENGLHGEGLPYNDRTWRILHLRPRTEASRHTAGEGIVPTPGPNPNYFSQGTNGLAGPAQFPQDPAGDVEPTSQTPVNTFYGEVPPQVSSGSQEGTVDGQGYSRAQQMQPPAGQPTASRHPFADGRTAAYDDAEDPRNHFMRGHYDARNGRPYGGEENQDTPHAQAYRNGWNAAHNDGVARVASTDGRIVGHCDNCNKPVRWHDDELRHLHSNSNACTGGGHAKTSAQQFFDPTDAQVRTVAVADANVPVPDDVDPDDEPVAPVTSSLRAQADVLEAPTSENPTGRGGDDYRARTWDSAVRQRPMQSADDRNANTPVLPQEPIRTLDTDGPRERGDSDENETDNQSTESREASLSIEQIMESN